MNLHLEVEISEIFYLKPRGGKKKKCGRGKKQKMETQDAERFRILPQAESWSVSSS